MLRILAIAFDFIRLNPFSFFCVVAFLKTFEVAYVFLYVLWSLNLWLLKSYGQYKTSSINLKNLVKIYLDRREKYTFKEISETIFPTDREILNSNRYIEHLTKKYAPINIKKTLSKVYDKVDTSIRVFVAKEKPPFSASIKSFGIRGGTSYIFLDRDYDEKNWKDRFRLLHEIGHCQVTTGQTEFESITHKEYAASTCFLLLFAIKLNSIVLIVVFLYLAINMLAKYDMRHKLSVSGYAEFMADAYALRFFLNKDVSNFENVKSFVLEKYEKDIERELDNNKKKHIQFKYEMINLTLNTNIMKEVYLDETSNIVGGYQKPMIPILLLNFFISVVLYLNLFMFTWHLLIPIIFLTLMNCLKYYGQLALSTELSIRVKDAFPKK